MAKTLEELQHYKAHYQSIYPKANLEGKAAIVFHLSKLQRRIERLQRKQYLAENSKTKI